MRLNFDVNRFVKYSFTYGTSHFNSGVNKLLSMLKYRYKVATTNHLLNAMCKNYFSCFLSFRALVELDAFEKIYQKYITDLKSETVSHSGCPLCHKKFKTPKEIKQLVDEVYLMIYQKLSRNYLSKVSKITLEQCLDLREVIAGWEISLSNILTSKFKCILPTGHCSNVI